MPTRLPFHIINNNHIVMLFGYLRQQDLFVNLTIYLITHGIEKSGNS